MNRWIGSENFSADCAKKTGFTSVIERMPSFTRYIGIDYSGAQTPTASLNGLRVYLAEGDAPPAEVLPPPSPRKYWSRRGIAEWLVERVAAGWRFHSSRRNEHFHAISPTVRFSSVSARRRRAEFPAMPGDKPAVTRLQVVIVLFPRGDALIAASGQTRERTSAMHPTYFIVYRDHADRW